MTKNCDLALAFKVGHNGLGAPRVMGLQRQVVDLIQAEARALADGAKNSTLRQLLTQRREGAGKHLWMEVDEQSVADAYQSESMTGWPRRVDRWRSGSLAWLNPR